LADGFAGEVGGVAVLAEVGEEDVAEVFGGDFGDEFGGGLVGEVAVAGEDSLFDRPGALGVVLEQGFVVVGLDDERVDALDGVDDLPCCVAEVGEDAEGGIRGGEDEAHGVCGVMGHGEGLDAEFSDLKGRAAVEEAPLGVDGAFAEAVGGERIGENRDAFFGAKNFESSGVVAVFVGEDDGTEAVGLDSELGETRAKLAGGKPRIDEDAGVIVADESTVARTAATEDRQMEHE
jgi:hypothetical protein